MSEDPAVRAPVRRIKIKFGNKLLSTHAVRVPGLTSSASQDSKDTKSGSALQLARLRQASLQGYVPPSATADAIVARLRDGEGFAPGSELPPWDFTAPLIVNSQERPAKRSRQLPCAEAKQPCPAPGLDAASVLPRREGLGSGPGRPDLVLEAKPQSTTKAEPLPEPTIICAVGSGESSAGTGMIVVGSGESNTVNGRTGVFAVGSGESNSDQATNSQAYLPLSPDDAGDGAARGGLAGPTGFMQPRDSSAGQSSLKITAPEPERPTWLNAAAKLPTTANTIATITTAAAAAAAASVSASVASAKEPKEACPAAPAAAAAAAQPPPPPPRTGPSAHGKGARSPHCEPATITTLTARGDAPSTSGREQPSVAPVSKASSKVSPGVSVETQTSQRDFPVLPLSFLELPRLFGTALSFQSIGPFDMQLERESRKVATEGQVDTQLEEARRVKRQGDQLFHSNQKVWTIKSLSKYVTASLMFMETADTILQRRDQRYTPRYVADLYRQTADLLIHTVANADTIRGNGIGKEALRLLAERLCAVCLLRHTTLMTGNFKALSDKATAALKEHQRQQATLGAGSGAAGGPSGSGPQLSPEDSSTSSLHVAHVGGGSGAAGAGGGSGGSSSSAPQPLPGFGHEQVSELLSYARTTWRFSEYMKRSSKSFEAFLERPDVRHDQQAKLVCMHLAAVCMDVGMSPGLRIIHHAREAVRTLCEDLAR